MNKRTAAGWANPDPYIPHEARWDGPTPPDPRSFRHMTPDAVADADATLCRLIARAAHNAEPCPSCDRDLSYPATVSR